MNGGVARLVTLATPLHRLAHTGARRGRPPKKKMKMLSSQPTAPVLAAASKPPRAVRAKQSSTMTMTRSTSISLSSSSSSSSSSSPSSLSSSLLSSVSRSVSLPQPALASSVADSSPSAATPPPTTYFCYLLRSDSPKHTGATYIGFTTNPIRRLRQHNGDLKSGAWRTSRKRPWSMICVVHGFPSKVSALQFEWQWTYPKRSRRLKSLMQSGRRWTAGARGKIELLYALLTSAPWVNFPLHVRYTSQPHFDDWHSVIMKRSDRELQSLNKALSLAGSETRDTKRFSHHIYELPSHIDVSAGSLIELEMYRYIHDKKGKRRKKSPTNSILIDSVSDSEESAMIDGIDDNEIVSGEESHDSEDDDGLEPGWEEPTTSDRDNDSDSGAITLSQCEPGSVAPRHDCHLCQHTLTLNARTRMFFTSCPHCGTTTHLTCAATHILRSLPSSSSSSSSSSETPRVEFPITLPVSPFVALSPSLPLIPPLNTGACSTCAAPWNWPVLVDRCRSMYVDAKGQRGGDTFYNAAAPSSMAKLMREFAGRENSHINKSKATNDSDTPAASKPATKRKRRASPVSTVESISVSSASQPVPASVKRRVNMFDGFTPPKSPTAARPVNNEVTTPISLSHPSNDTVSRSNCPLSPVSAKRALMANAASKRLGLFSSTTSSVATVTSAHTNNEERRAVTTSIDDNDVVIISHTTVSPAVSPYQPLFRANDHSIYVISDSEDEVDSDGKENTNCNGGAKRADSGDDDDVLTLSLRERLARRNNEKR